jgi:hypothetical protein
MEILLVGAEMVHGDDRRREGERETEGQKSISKQRAAFNNFTIVPEDC